MPDNNRINIIVNEINYWKRNKLLPDTYCDYLLALYTKGESDDFSKSSSFQTVIPILQLVLCTLLLPFSFLVIYFTRFEDVLQLTILFLFLIYAIWCFKSLKKHTNNLSHVALVNALFIMLLFSIHLGKTLASGNFFVYITILLNFICWFFLGYIKQLKYLKYASIIGLIFAILYYFIKFII
ncbi:hypothetical protein DTX80_02125 [Bacilli bacterium]|nr:hypothetical protein DEJ60_07485 [Bacilli bacterium]PZD88973.1 hypothetical protein DEJ64_02030 [Bacilli bacterium]PZD92401.1 hypothetical protein DEJ66_02315 [Bacilli bacterium]RCO07333.1 hypothetical protein DTX80_02125 [Bacilli bacterium]RCO11198.1 hypothetical protein DTX79_00655 [Bacilli bacterium]